MKKPSLWMVPAVLSLLAASAAAQGFWDKKEWKKWSADECKKMMEDSPWAQKWTQEFDQTAQFSTYNQSTGRGTGGGAGTGDEAHLRMWYIVEFRSAQPIREAVARQAQIQMKYDSMDEKQRAAVDQQTEKYVNAIYPDVVVVHVLYGSNVPVYERQLATFWQNNFPPGVVPQEAFLDLSTGKKVIPIRMVSPRTGADEFELIFPRVVDGQPLLTDDSKVLGIEFQAPTIGKIPGDRVHIEFKTSKMRFNGAVVY